MFASANDLWKPGRNHLSYHLVTTQIFFGNDRRLDEAVKASLGKQLPSFLKGTEIFKYLTSVAAL